MLTTILTKKTSFDYSKFVVSCVFLLKDYKIVGKLLKLWFFDWLDRKIFMKSFVFLIMMIKLPRLSKINFSWIIGILNLFSK